MGEMIAKPKKRWRLPLLITSLVALGMVWLIGDHKIPTGPAEGDQFQSTLVPTIMPTTFRVGTYNIAGGVGLDGKLDLSRTADAIKDCDFVALNEVHGFINQPQNQSRIIATQYLDRGWLFAPVERRWFHDDFGNGAIARKRFWMKHWKRIPISSPTSPDNRNVVVVQAELNPVNSRIVTILLTHIDRKDDHERELELHTVVKMFAEAPEPAILLGDMNTMPEDSLSAILHVPGSVDVIDEDLPLEQSQKHLDWILLRGLHCIKAGFYPKGTSDHPFFWADVAVDGARTQSTSTNTTRN